MDEKLENKTQYFEWNSELGYQLYLKIEQSDLVEVLKPTLEIVGFGEIVDENFKQKKITSAKSTRIITIKKASPALGKKIDYSGGLFDSFAQESVYTQSISNVYRFKNTALLLFDENKIQWELALKINNLDLNNFRVVMTRAISFALSTTGVVGLWGIPVEEGVVVRRPYDSQFESVFIDLDKNLLITYNGIQNIESGLSIIRLDQTMMRDFIRMKHDELIPFLSSHCTYFSYAGMHPRIKQSLYKLAQLSDGLIYPEERFKPRNLEA